ncbi:MAG: N-methyl-L-tryptophan oxidase [Halorubrum sp.]|uniref:N-methyl-L-tryptophan oxidase n=1 Tax=Halorubrum sp. TaxID=1879286 RepID=UPI0039707958
MDEYDAVVIGAGVIGCAAARALAGEGRDVLLLERGDVPNPRATSSGPSRIFRLAYHEGGTYVPLLRRSRRLWQRLDRDADVDLFRRTGSLTIGPESGDSFTGARATCRTRDIDHEVLAATEVNDRFPAYDLPEGYSAVFQPDGGLLDPERCIVALVEAAMADGAEVRAREPVVEWTADEETVRVRTPRRVYDADSLVVASGAWAADHVDAVEGVVERERHVACRIRPRIPAAFAPDSFPVFVMDTEDGRHFYGLPRHRVPGFKVGATHVEGAAVHPDDVRDAGLVETEPARGFARDFAPSGDGPVLGTRACVLSQTPDGDYLIDTLPDLGNVVVAVGMSGHGFKTAPVVGEVAAALATDSEPPVDADPFAIDRFE